MSHAAVHPGERGGGARRGRREPPKTDAFGIVFCFYVCVTPHALSYKGTFPFRRGESPGKVSNVGKTRKYNTFHGKRSPLECTKCIYIERIVLFFLFLFFFCSVGLSSWAASFA